MGRLKSPVGLSKVIEMSKRLRGVTGVALVKVDGVLKLIPMIDVERMRLAGRSFELIASAETARELYPYVRLLSSLAKT